MNIMVGCPAYQRDWCLPLWFEHITRTFDKVGCEPHYVFVLAHEDEATRDVVFHSSTNLRVTFTDQETLSSQRSWNERRYREMVRLRNTLLEMVREDHPDFFLSIDSDILAHEGLLYNLLETAEHFDAVGGKCYLTDVNELGQGARCCPSWANVGRTKQLIRQDAEGMFAVDAIMAIKLMSPVAYAIDYLYDEQGEDLGWSRNCRENGVKLAFDGRVISKHLMTKRALTMVDQRLGW